MPGRKQMENKPTNQPTKGISGNFGIQINVCKPNIHHAYWSASNKYDESIQGMNIMCYKNSCVFFLQPGHKCFSSGKYCAQSSCDSRICCSPVCFRLSLLVRNPTQTQKYQKVPMLTAVEKSVYFKSLVCAKVCYTKALECLYLSSCP